MRTLIRILCLAFCLLAGNAWALSPYLAGQNLPKAELNEQLASIENKLKSAGFIVLGRHMAKGLTDRGAVVFTDKSLLDVVRATGKHSIMAAGLRVGVTSAGALNFTLPEYWMRAYMRGDFRSGESTASKLQVRLEKIFGPTQPMGGDVPAARLAEYQYMSGMERLDAIRSELHNAGSFEEALKTVQSNLGKGVDNTVKVYEVILPEQQLAVFGVGMNKPGSSEAWWLKKLGAIGQDYTAALPYEIYIIGGKVYSLYGRYRMALAFPGLDLGQFMNIRYAPDVVWNTMNRVAGAPEPTTMPN